MYIESTTTTLQSSFLLTSKEFINTPRLKTGLPPWIVHVLCVLFGCKIPNLDQQRVGPDPMSLTYKNRVQSPHEPKTPLDHFDTGSTAMLNHKKVSPLSPDINRVSTCGVCGPRDRPTAPPRHGRPCVLETNWSQVGAIVAIVEVHPQFPGASNIFWFSMLINRGIR
jgi:hypothetical protein